MAACFPQTCQGYSDWIKTQIYTIHCLDVWLKISDCRIFRKDFFFFNILNYLYLLIHNFLFMQNVPKPEALLEVIVPVFLQIKTIFHINSIGHIIRITAFLFSSSEWINKLNIDSFLSISVSHNHFFS